MICISYGTRPEIIKLKPLMDSFLKNNIQFKSLFTGQHKDLFQDFNSFVTKPDITFENVFSKGQSINEMLSKIIIEFNKISSEFSDVFVQGDTSSAVGIALAAFNNKIRIHHIEAGLRTFDKHSPFPEEINRQLISKLADFHYCPTHRSAYNLKLENITKNVFVVGNTIVDIYKQISESTSRNQEDYYIVSLHRRENRGERMVSMIQQLNQIDDKIIFIKHPSIDQSFYDKHVNSKNIELIEPVNYLKIVNLIQNSKGIISDSGGLQEEAVCANKKILICRDTTERPETVDSGFGKLIDTDIIGNMDFFKIDLNKNISHVYGNNVCEKICKVVKGL